MRYQYNDEFATTQSKKPVSERFGGLLDSLRSTVATGQVFTPTASNAVDRAQERFGAAAEQFKGDAKNAIDQGFEDFRRTSAETINSYTSAIDAVQARNREKAASRRKGTGGFLGLGLQAASLIPGVGPMVGKIGELASKAGY